MATVNYVRYRSQSRTALRKVVDYIQQSDKTDGQRYVIGQNCSPMFAAEEFIATRSLYGKDSPVWFYHYTQAFSPTEAVTPEQAHALAKEFAAQAWPDSEVLIATHVDAKHIHSHFLVNAVCHETGRMLRQGPHTLERLRRISDGLCMRHGFSVLDQKKQRRVKGMSAREYRAAAKGQSWKFQLMFVIDECMRRARFRQEFIELMKKQGYEIKWMDERKNITYTAPNGMKCRDYRLHDEKYLKENMEREFRIREEIIYGRIKRAQQADDAGDSSDGAGMGGTAGGDRDIELQERGDLHGASPVANAGDTGAGREADGGGTYPADDAPTGWEEERAALFTPQAFTPGVLPALAAGHPGHAGDGGSVIRDALRFGSDLEHLQDDVPVIDATTHSIHGDRKQLRKEQEKKIAMGHKPDDHEQPQAWQQQAMR